MGPRADAYDASGKVTGRFRYDAFGLPRAYTANYQATVLSAASYRFLFRGREWISGVGLNDHRNRYDSTRLGRWISPDPIRFDAGVNIYAYVKNSPISCTDPMGLDTAVSIGMGTSGMGTSGNPFGHAAMAMTGFGTYSFGTRTDWAGNFRDFLTAQAAYRDTTVYVLHTTPAQEKAGKDYLETQNGKAMPLALKDNCAVRTNDALKQMGINLDATGLPASTQRGLDDMVDRGEALKFNVPKGSTPSDAWNAFNAPSS